MKRAILIAIVLAGFVASVASASMGYAVVPGLSERVNHPAWQRLGLSPVVIPTQGKADGCCGCMCDGQACATRACNPTFCALCGPASRDIYEKTHDPVTGQRIGEFKDGAYIPYLTADGKPRGELDGEGKHIILYPEFRVPAVSN
jgi:hypothetical protein